MTIAQQLNVKHFPFIIRNAMGQQIYIEYSTGHWQKREWGANENVIYFEDSFGCIDDNRPKTEIQKAIELLTQEGLLVNGKVLKN